MSCYVYVLRRPCGEPFYVGKGTGLRAEQHIHEARRGVDYNPHKNRIIRKLIDAGQEPIVEIVATFDTDEAAYEFEADLISKTGRRNIGTGPLVNICAGGAGVVGYPQTPAIREAKRKGALKRYQNPVERERQAEHMRAIAADPEISARTRAAKIASITPERREAASTASAAAWADPEARERMLAGQRAYVASEEGRADMRARHQAKLATGFRPNTKAVVVDGVRYETIRDAAASIGVKSKTLNARFLRWKKAGSFPAGYGYVGLPA